MSTLYNRVIEKDNYAIILTRKGEKIVCDIPDLPLLERLTWCISNGAAQTTFPGTKQREYMHRMILAADRDETVDHINHNRTDNRRSNLRKCTRSQNSMNRKVQSNSTSGISGVRYVESMGKWKASIKVRTKRIHLGYFKTLSDAVRIRKRAEVKYFGSFRYEGSDLRVNAI